MIQRKQSLFLLVASLGFWSLFKLPFASSNKIASPFFEDQLLNINDHVILLVLCILGGVLTAATILLFNNRKLQLRLGILNIIFSLFLIVVALWVVFSKAPSIDSTIDISDNIGLYMPLLSFICVVLANYFIKKDDNLVRSADRLR